MAYHLESAIKAFRWELEFDDDENVIGIELVNSYYDETDKFLFTTLTSYIKANCFIKIVGKDHDIWRWYFDGKSCKLKKPTITWGDE